MTEIARCTAATIDVIVGVADYDRYLAHMAQNHPDQPAMTRAEFFNNRQANRYASGRGLRCC